MHRQFHAAPSPGGGAESRRCRDQAVTQNPGPGGAESKRCCHTAPTSGWPGGGAESWRCRDHQAAAQSSGCAESQATQSPGSFDSGGTESSWHCRLGRRVQAAVPRQPSPFGGAESRRCRDQPGRRLRRLPAFNLA